jgi:hypothetical protein
MLDFPSYNLKTSPELVGMGGFEPPASASRTLRANQAALHPENVSIYSTNYRQDFKETKSIQTADYKAFIASKLTNYQIS